MNTGTPKDLQDKSLVLVIDSDLEQQFRTTVQLQRLEYHVFPLSTAEDALKIMGLAIPRAVVTALSLPRMNGLDLLKRVKQDPRIRQVPVLICTAADNDVYRKMCEQAGCAAFLVRNGDCSTLYRAIQKATEPTPRNFIRLNTWLDVSVASPEGDQAALVTAISEQGMFVNTANLLPYGTIVRFTLYLPKLASGGVSLMGRVLYSHGGGAGRVPGMGVKFLETPPEIHRLITAFIESKLSEGLAAGRGRGIKHDHLTS